MALNEELSTPDPSSDQYFNHQFLEKEPDSKPNITSLLQNREGFIVGRFSDELLRFKTDAHFLTVSPTGGGKTSGVIIPNLIDHPGSSVVLDIRGETVARTATAKRLQGQHVVVLDPYNITGGEFGIDRFNPFDRLVESLDSVDFDDKVQRFVSALMFDPSGRTSNEPIWDNATKLLLSGLVTYCVKCLPSYRQNLNEILKILNQTESEREDFIIDVLSYLDGLATDSDEPVLKSLVQLLTESKSTTKITDNAIVQARTVLTWVGNKAFSKSIGYSTFSFSELENGATTIFIVIPEEFIDNCAVWVRVIIESAIFSIPDVYSDKKVSTINLPQENRVLFLLDELPAFGQLDIISKGMATLRGKGVNLWLFIQNLAQLEDIYGKNKSRTIIGNAAVLQAFNSNELEELEYFSRLIGEEFMDIQTISIGKANTTGTAKTTNSSKTLSNSESVTTNSSTADSFTESQNSNWSKSKGWSRNSSTSTGRTSSYGKNKGRNRGYSGNKSRHDPDQESEGWNSGKNRGSSWQNGTQSNISSGQGMSGNSSYGGGQSNSRTHGTTDSKGHSSQTGSSFTEGKSESQNESFTENRGISVKKERLKIETVRSLREKMSDRNQLLLLRGSHPFFIPKMSYFVKFIDRDYYMFPDFVSLLAPETLKYLKTKTYIEKPSGRSHIKDGLSQIKNLKDSFQSYLKTKENSARQVLSIVDIPSKEILKLMSKVESSCDHLNEQRIAFSEVADMTQGLIRIFQSAGVGIFESDKNSDQIILDKLEKLNSPSKDNYLDQLLAVTKLIQGAPFSDIRKNYENRLEDEKTGYLLRSGDAEWLLTSYSSFFMNAFRKLEAPFLTLDKVWKNQENCRVWLLQIIDKIQREWSNLEIATNMTDDALREEFYRQRYLSN